MLGQTGMWRQFSTVNIDTDSQGGPVPIKINIAKSVSPQDLLKEQLEKVHATKMPVCFYPNLVK